MDVNTLYGMGLDCVLESSGELKGGLGCYWIVLISNVADGVGFEPTVRVNARRFSRPVP